MSASCGSLLGSIMKQVPDVSVTTMKLWMGCLKSFFQPATTTTTTTTSNDSSNNNNSSAEGNSNNSEYVSDQPITTTVTNSCTRENVMKDDAIASEDNSIPIPIPILLATTINTAIATGKKMDEEGRNLSSTSTYDNTIESIRAILDLDIIGGVNWKWIANMMIGSDVLACNILRRNNSPSIKSTFTSFKSRQMIHPTAYLIKTLGLSLKLNILCTKTRTEIQSLSDEAERINDLWTTNLEDNKILTAKLWIRRARSNTSRASALIASGDILLKLMELNFVCNSGLFHARIMNENNNDNDDDDNGDDGGGERRALITANKINAYHEINKELTSEIQESIKHADEITRQMVHSEYDKCSNCNCNTMYHKDSLILFGSIIQKYNEGSSTSSVFICFQCTDHPEQKAVQVGCGEMLQILEEDRLSSNPTSSGNNTKKKSNRKKKKKRKKKLTHINNNNDDTADPLEKIRGPPNAASSPSSVLLFPHPLPESRFFCSTTTTSKDGGNDDDDNDTGSSDSKTFILRDDETEDNSLGSSWSARGDIIVSDHHHQTTTSATKKGTASALNDDLVDYLLQTGSIIALNDYMDMLGLDNDNDTDNDNFGDCDDLKEV